MISKSFAAFTNAMTLLVGKAPANNFDKETIGAVNAAWRGQQDNPLTAQQRSSLLYKMAAMLLAEAQHIDEAETAPELAERAAVEEARVKASALAAQQAASQAAGRTASPAPGSAVATAGQGAT